MHFENPGTERPKSLRETLQEDLAAAEEDLKGHYKDTSLNAFEVAQTGKEKSLDLLALRMAAKTLEESADDADAAIASLREQLKMKDRVANPDVYERAMAILERKSQAN